MFKSLKISSLLISSICILSFSCFAQDEFSIVTDATNQYVGGFYGSKVVYKNFSATSTPQPLSGIHSVDINTHESYVLPNSNNGMNPAIYGNRVVWDSGGNEIGGYDFSTSNSLSISINRLTTQTLPSIYENTVVWSEIMTSGVDLQLRLYGYDLNSSSEFEIKTFPSVSDNSSFFITRPEIFGNNVIWGEPGDGVHVYNIQTDTETVIEDINIFDSSPVIHQNTVLWSDSNDIYSYNLVTMETKQITNDTDEQLTSDMWGDIIVYSDNRNGNFDVFGYDILTDTEFQITNNPFDQKSPRIYGDTVIWTDNRNGNADIYGTVIPEPSTILIFLSGIFGMVWFRKKK